MKRYLVGLLAAGMVFALVMGSAAGLDFGEVEPLQVGTTDEGALECDDTVDVQVGFEDPDTLTSDTVIVSDIDDTCEGSYLVAFALDDEDNLLAKAIGVLGEDTDSTRNPAWTWENGAAQISWIDEGAWNKPNPRDIERVRIHINA